MHIGIWGCRQFKMRGPDFSGKQRFFLIALTCHCTLKSSTNRQQICSSFSLTQPTLQKRLQIQTYKTHYTSLNSHRVYMLCSYLFMPEHLERDIKDHLQINKRSKSMFTGMFTVISDCSLKTIVQKHKLTALIASYSSINILDVF